MITAFYIIVLLFSVILHEIAHGYIALRLGDTTARDAGRLTLNPIKHIDLFGTIILPLLFVMVGAPVFGWAKPVPYDPRFLKNPQKASGLIALAGPATNFSLAIFFALISRIVILFPLDQFLSTFYLFLAVIVQVNIALAIFNLLPIPPLDGSGVLFSVLPRGTERMQAVLHRYGFILLIALIYMGLDFLHPAMDYLYKMLLGPASPIFL